MSTELHAANGRHNHPPRCCCSPDDMGRGIIICPVCPEHGELAPTVECPQCHQPAGRPHTEYCPLAIREEVFASRPYDPERDPMLNLDGEPIGQTSQPATRTSQPDTQGRANEHHQWLHALDTTVPTEHRTTSVHWHDIERCTPAWCGATPEDGEV